MFADLRVLFVRVLANIRQSAPDVADPLFRKILGMMMAETPRTAAELGEMGKYLFSAGPSIQLPVSPRWIIHPEGEGRICMDLASRGLSLPRNGKDFHSRLARGFWSNKQKCQDMRVLGQFHSFVAEKLDVDCACQPIIRSWRLLA